MGIDSNTIDVTGRFDDVTGQYNPALILYHKGKKRDCDAKNIYTWVEDR